MGDSKSAFCKQDCPSDWDCTDLTKTRDLEVVHSGSSLYCYALWFSTKGGKSKVPDDELLAWQLKNGKSIFACQAWDVFSDVPLSVNGEYDAIQLKDGDGDWYRYTRSDTGAAANAAIFISAWKVIREQQKWRDQEWGVKADADAVFIPQRLQDLLSRQAQPNTGIYYENCKGVDSGFFGSLEVISTRGFKIFVDKLEDCKSTLAWDGNPSSGWKYGPEEAPATERVLERPGGHSGRRSKVQIVWVGVMGSFFLCDAKFIINLSVLKDVGHNTLGVIELLFLQQSIVLKRPWASYTLAALHPPCR